LYLYRQLSNNLAVNKRHMKKVSVILFIVGIIVTIGLIIYFRSVVNPVDSDSMTISRSGSKVSEWPLFVGIIFTFVGCVFYYVSHYEKKSK
jgi:hypothetical protein